MERIEELCCLYLSHLRAINLIHQQSHWITKGANSYGQHLLFERIYKSSVDDTDLAAEKLVGLFGEDSIDFQAQGQLISKLLEKAATDSPTETSLAAEKHFLEFSQKFYDALETEGKMTLGLDDAIMTIASKREEACYLLQQSLPEQKDEPMNSKMAARKALLKRMANFNVQELHQKALNELNALVVSYVPGTYTQNDITISIDWTKKAIMGNAVLPTAISPQKQEKIQNAFQSYVQNVLPPNMKDFAVGVGFVSKRK